MIDYSKGFRFLGIRPEIRIELKSTLSQMNVAVESDNEAILYHFPRDEAIQFKVE